jgi:predicted ATPase
MNIMDEMDVYNKINTTNLQYIDILGLFGRYDIEIPFDKEVNIYIGENGLGKTTILNCIYYLLKRDFSKLENINFKEIHIKFQSKNTVYKITPFDLAKFNHLTRRGLSNSSRAEYMEHFLNDFEEHLSMNSDETFEYDYELKYAARKLARQMGIPLLIAQKKISQYIKQRESLELSDMENGSRKRVRELIKAIKENISQRIIYLPTYRRIEDDFSSLHIKKETLDGSELLIQFGMSDVQMCIDRILEKIRTEAMRGFTEMTGVLLRQYVDDQKVESGLNNSACPSIDIETVQIVLDRAGNEIEQLYKDQILKLIENREIYNPKFRYLLNLIVKLISNYSLQKIYDDRIKKFSNTCNKYLRNKHFQYNQSTLNLAIYLEKNGSSDEKTLELTQLSSGEKQIVSLFSKLYLESDEKSIVIIDEPELSLSLQWQQMLLPDIMRTENCKLLLTVTHSPFIFENEFDYDAKEMRKYIKINE